MTNRDFLETLPVEELAKMMSGCGCCVYEGSSVDECRKHDCAEGMMKWLGGKHEGN